MKYACALLLCMQTLLANQPQPDVASPTLSQQVIECFAQSTDADQDEQQAIRFSCTAPNQGYAQLTTHIPLDPHLLVEEPVLLELEKELVQHKIIQAFKALYRIPTQAHDWVSPTESFYILDEYTKCTREEGPVDKQYLRCITYIKAAHYNEIMQQESEDKT